MRMNPYLNFNGNCREAFAFYADVFNGTIEAMETFGETPMREHMASDWFQKIWFARMKFGDVDLMATDTPGPMYVRPQGFAVSAQVAGLAEAERIFAALGEGGHVAVPLCQNFWAERFGIVTDRFGTPWIINCPPSTAD